ncbi:MAG: AAA family ATPase [bacterium]|nr:AAA family ATPase [bacterium]
MPTTLHKLIIRNFKQFDEIEIELGNTVVFVGPNNSGKTTALQALSLWHIGVQKWLAQKGGKRTRIPINRKDLFSIPNTSARMLWRNLTTQKQGIKKDVFDISITLEAITNGKQWRCGMEFRFDNNESFYCTPIKIEGQEPAIPDEAKNLKVAFLPIMAGLSVIEPRVDAEFIERLIGEGRTAEVLRNMCYLVYQTPYWDELVNTIKKQFGIILQEPHLDGGTITLEYKTREGIVLDLLASGSGVRQTLFILAHLYLNQNVILLLDEPDAHLEIIRQRQIYDLINDVAKQQNSQVIIASHSEIILDKATENDIVIAFVGKPHRTNDRASQLRKALRDISGEDYYRAEITGWVLYLEGETDLSIMRAFAKQLNHPVLPELEKVFFHPIRQNEPIIGREHFRGLREAKPDLIGFILVDNIKKELQRNIELVEMMWKRREIENYIALPEVLLAYAGVNHEVMNTLLKRRLSLDALENFEDIWWYETKLSDFLDRLFKDYFAEINLSNQINKTNYHILADYLTPEQVHPEIIEKLDAIYEVAKRAKPRT